MAFENFVLNGELTEEGFDFILDIEEELKDGEVLITVLRDRLKSNTDIREVVISYAETYVNESVRALSEER